MALCRCQLCVLPGCACAQQADRKRVHHLLGSWAGSARWAFSGHNCFSVQSAWHALEAGLCLCLHPARCCQTGCTLHSSAGSSVACLVCTTEAFCQQRITDPHHLVAMAWHRLVCLVVVCLVLAYTFMCLCQHALAGATRFQTSCVKPLPLSCHLSCGAESIWFWSCCVVQRCWRTLQTYCAGVQLC